jgi:large subunit ribosomal protein L20
MARVKRGVTARKKHKKIIKLAKGYRGSQSKLYRPANQAVLKALSHSYRGRKLRKRDFRKLWIARINAAARSNGMSYSRFINGLKKAGIQINRKMLSEMAINDASGFTQLVDIAKANVQ